MRTQQTLQRVNQLKTENDMLEEKIKLLSKELGFLKELFMAQAGTLSLIIVFKINFSFLDCSFHILCYRHITSRTPQIG